MSRMHLPLWLKILWTIWVIAWAPLYWRQYGAQNFLYFCDLGNFLIAVGLWLESPLIFSWQATGLLLYLLAVPILIYWPTHLLLQRWAGKQSAAAAARQSTPL